MKNKKVGKNQKSNIKKTYSELVGNLRKKSLRKTVQTKTEMAEEILNLLTYQDHSPIEDQERINKKIKDLFNAHFTKDMLINLIMKHYGYQWTIEEVRRILFECLTPTWWKEIRDNENRPWGLDRWRLENRLNFRSLSPDAQLNKIVRSQMDFIKEHNPKMSRSMLRTIQKSVKEHNKLWNQFHKQTMFVDQNPLTGQVVCNEHRNGKIGQDIRGTYPSGVLDLDSE